MHLAPSEWSEWLLGLGKAGQLQQTSVPVTSQSRICYEWCSRMLGVRKVDIWGQMERPDGCRCFTDEAGLTGVGESLTADGGTPPSHHSLSCGFASSSLVAPGHSGLPQGGPGPSTSPTDRERASLPRQPPKPGCTSRHSVSEKNMFHFQGEKPQS